MQPLGEVYTSSSLDQAYKYSNSELQNLDKQGFDFGLAVKNTYKVFLNLLLTNAKELNLSVEECEYIFENWSQLADLIENKQDFSKLSFREKQIYLLLSETYWEVYSQIDKNIITQLKESKVYDKDLLLNDSNYNPEIFDKLKNFLLNNHFRNRVFENNFDSKFHQLLISSALENLKIKNDERSYVELLNLLRLWELRYGKASDIISEFKGLPAGLVEFMEVELLRLRGLNLQNEDLFIEFSPPIYEHQSDLMLRIYEYSSDGWRSKIYSVPYSEVDVIFDISNLQQVSIANLESKTLNKLENRILSNTLLVKQCDKDKLLKNLSVIQRVGGIEVLDLNDAILKPKMDIINQELHPFINSFIKDLPLLFKSESSFNKYRNWYEQVVDAAWLQFRPKNQNINEVDVQKINSDLLQEVVNGSSVSEFISQNTNILKDNPNGIKIEGEEAECGKIAIEIKSQGEKIEVESGAKLLSNDSKTQLADLGFDIQQSGKIVGNDEVVKNLQNILGEKVFDVEISEGKNTPLVFFKSLNKKGEVESRLLCPVCGEGSVDVCDILSTCTNCGIREGVLKDAYDKGLLHELRNKYEGNLQKKSFSKFQESKRISAIDTFLENLLGFKWILP